MRKSTLSWGKDSPGKKIALGEKALPWGKDSPGKKIAIHEKY